MKLKSILALALVFGVVSCSKKEEATTTNSSEAPQEITELKSILLEDRPSDSVSILELRKDAKVGDTVSFDGKIMGAMTVLVDGRAVMVVGDPEGITSCDLRPGDNCETPWDVCCDSTEDIKRSIVTVQAVDANGDILKEGFRDLGGIKELSEIVVQGTVAEGSNKDNLVVNTTGIYVVD